MPTDRRPAGHCANATLLVAWLLMGLQPVLAHDPDADPGQVRALFVGTWKLTSHWTNDLVKLGSRPGEGMGGYSGTAIIKDDDGQLSMEIVAQAPDGTRWEKQIALLASPYRLTLDLKNTRRRASATEYTKLELVLSPDRTMMRGVASWSNGLNGNRSNEERLLRAQTPSIYFPWGVGGSSWRLTREGSPPESGLVRSEPAEQPTLLLEGSDPDSLAEEDALNATLDECAQWLTSQGFRVVREKGDTSPQFRALLEVARFQPNITGQETYLDTVANQPVRFLKGTIPIGAALTIKDAKGKRTLMSVALERSRESATPDDDPKTRVTPRGTILLPANMPAEVAHLLHLLPGQAAALPAKQKRSEYLSRLEELLLKGE